MLIVLDNAESVLDPQGMDAQDIYAVMDELSQFSNICLCITSRITTLPPGCEVFDIPTLSMEAGRDTFYRIYKHSEQSGPVNDILEQLDFHPLSITLLATVAQHNGWDADRLTSEWGKRQTGVLHARHSRSLATTIELSLASSMFQELGPDAQELLGVIAFLPQGVDKKTIDWLFPTISDGPNMFDKFCVLSLTYRSNGFITMLAPLRDHLRPKNPRSSPIFDATKQHYFTRLSVELDPDKPGFREARWITSEDVNIKSHAVGDPYLLARAVRLQAWLWYHSVGLKKPNLRDCALLVCSRGSGPRTIWTRLEGSSSGSTVMHEEMDHLMNRMRMVSYPKQRYLSCPLTLRVQTRSLNLNDGSDS